MAELTDDQAADQLGDVWTRTLAGLDDGIAVTPAPGVPAADPADGRGRRHRPDRRAQRLRQGRHREPPAHRLDRRPCRRARHEVQIAVTVDPTAVEHRRHPATTWTT